MKTGNLIVDLSFELALRIIPFCETLEEKRKFVIANQLLKSGASIGANVREAQHCESKADFVHKLKIASKEADETVYWLSLCKFSETYPFEPALLDEVLSVQKVLSKIISSSKGNGTNTK